MRDKLDKILEDFSNVKLKDATEADKKNINEILKKTRELNPNDPKSLDSFHRYLKFKRNELRTTNG